MSYWSPYLSYPVHTRDRTAATVEKRMRPRGVRAPSIYLPTVYTLPVLHDIMIGFLCLMLCLLRGTLALCVADKCPFSRVEASKYWYEDILQLQQMWTRGNASGRSTVDLQLF